MKSFFMTALFIAAAILFVSCGVEDDLEETFTDSACENLNSFKCDGSILLKCEDYVWEKIRHCEAYQTCNAAQGTCDGTGENNGDNNDNGGNANSVYCGNNILEAGEVCDGDAKECAAIDTGFSGGYAMCRTDCQGYDTTGCTGTPVNPDPGDNGNTNPGTDPGNNGGSNPGTDPGNNGGSNPGTNPGDNGGNNPGTNPGDNGGNNPGTNPGDNGGNDTPATGCKEITLDTKLTYEPISDDIPAYYTSYTIDGQKKERFGIELNNISGDVNGTYDDFANMNYADEGILDLIIYENWDGSDATGYYFQRADVDGMMVEISGYNSATHRITVKFTNVILEEVTIPGLDNEDFTSHPVPNGECLKVKDTTVSY